MKNLILVIVFSALLCISAGALPHDGLLKIEGGAAKLELACGHKRRLRVSAGLAGMPVAGRLSFSSTDPLVAVLHAGLPGKAYVTVTDAKGRCDSILVVVSGGKAPALLLILPLAAIALIKIKNR